MRGLPPGHKDKHLEDLVVKMQDRGHYNARYDTHIYLRIPSYAKPTLRLLLQINRIPEPINIKCMKKAHLWMSVCMQKICFYRQRSGGVKGRNKNQALKNQLLKDGRIYRKHCVGTQADWFRANILASVYRAFEAKADALMQIDACKYCCHA